MPVALTNVTFAGNWSCSVALAAGPVPLLVTVRLYVLLLPTTSAGLGWDLVRFSAMPLAGVLTTCAAQPAVGLFCVAVLHVAGAGGVVPPVGPTEDLFVAVAVLVVVTTILTTGALAPAAIAGPL